MTSTTSVYYTVCTFCEKVREAFKLFISLVQESQMRRAAFWTAHHLIATNEDFKGMSHHELMQRIMDTSSPTYIDGTPVKKSK